MTDAKNGGHASAADSIYAALIQLMQIKPYVDITITDITRLAGVSRMAFYRHYGDKDRVLLKRLERHMSRIAGRYDPQSGVTEAEACNDFFATFREDPVIGYIIQAGLVDSLIDFMRTTTIGIYRDVFHWDVSDLNNLMTIYRRMGSVLGLLLYNIEYRDRLDPQALTRQLMDISVWDELHTKGQ